MSAASTAYLTAIAVLIFIAAIADAASSTSHANHTVGGSAGWFFNSSTDSSAANYSDWADAQTFNLGDYLIFKSSTNQTVIQTYNLTTYNSCATNDSSDSDTFIYNSGNPTFDEAVTIPVPLTKEGTNYFFSDAQDGVQCQRGMRFQIKVNHGSGLPPSLNQPPPPPYTSAPAYEPPEVFQGSGGGQGESIKDSGMRCGGAAAFSAFVLGMFLAGVRMVV